MLRKSGHYHRLTCITKKEKKQKSINDFGILSNICFLHHLQCRDKVRRRMQNQESKMVCNERAATWMTDTLWWFLFSDTRGTPINRTSDMSSMQIWTWPLRSHKTSCLKADSFQFIVKIQKPQTTFLTTLGNQRAWNIVLGDETFSCDLQSSCRLLPHAPTGPRPLEKRKDLARQTVDRGAVLEVDTVESLFRRLSITPGYRFSEKRVFPTWKVRGNNACNLWKH